MPCRSPRLVDQVTRGQSGDLGLGESPPSGNSLRRGAEVAREGWLGDYDFGYLCTPSLPFGKGKGRRQPPPFYSLNADLPMLLALVCGESPYPRPDLRL
jgi:hypothetical protein